MTRDPEDCPCCVECTIFVPGDTPVRDFAKLMDALYQSGVRAPEDVIWTACDPAEVIMDDLTEAEHLRVCDVVDTQGVVGVHVEPPRWFWSCPEMWDA